MDKRLHWIDIAKGIGIFSIVLGHVAFKEIGYIVFMYHVPLFFWLAGYTFKRESDFYSFLYKKFTRLIVPYFITCIGIWIMDLLNAVFLFNDHDLITILKKDLLRTIIASGSRTDVFGHNIGQMIGAIWFLPALFFSLIMVWFIKKIEKFSIQFLIAILLCLAAVYSAKIIWFPFSIQPAMMAVFFILLGNWQKEHPFFLQKSYFIIIYFIFMILGFFLSLLKGDVVISIVRCHFLSIVTPMIVFCNMMFILKISLEINNFPFLEYYGKNSLIALCIHLISLNTFSPWIRHVSENKYFYALIQLAVVVILTPVIEKLTKIKNNSK